MNIDATRLLRLGATRRTRTPVLGHDRADLAAALQTIREIGDDQATALTELTMGPDLRIRIPAYSQDTPH